MYAPRFPPPPAPRSGNISPCRAAQPGGGNLENRIPRGGRKASRRTGDHSRDTIRAPERRPSDERRVEARRGRPRRGPRPRFLSPGCRDANDGSDRRQPDRAGSYDLTAAPSRGGGSIGRRVRSWLRMNAGGAPNTCKSNGTRPRAEASGERLSNTWRTCPPPGDSRRKRRVTPDDPAPGHPGAGKTQVEGDGSAAHQVDGGVTAHRADNG